LKKPFIKILLLTTMLVLGTANFSVFAEISTQESIEFNEETNVEISKLETRELKFRKEFGLEKDINKIQQYKRMKSMGWDCLWMRKKN
jgi:hypothetical protein